MKANLHPGAESKLANWLKVCFPSCMTKAEARALFGDRVADLAAALGITPQAIYQWPDDLDQATADRVTGAALRLGRLPTQRSAEATA